MKLKIKGQQLTPDKKIIAEGSQSFATFTIEVSDSWKGLSKTIRFRHTDSDRIYDVPCVEEGRSYYIPPQVLIAGDVEVGAIGIGDTAVATTTKALFKVEGNIGGSPTVSPDVYAMYVRQVEGHSKNAKECEKAVKGALDRCIALTQRAEELHTAVRESEKRISEMHAQVSGMLDAVGSVLGTMERRSEQLLRTDSDLMKGERARCERDRAHTVNENSRAAAESQRRERERERDLGEMMRAESEKLRAVRDAERSQRLREAEERLESLEAKLHSPTRLTYSVKGEGELTEELTRVTSVVLYGRTTVSEGKAFGIGEGGSVSLTLCGRTVDIPLSQPLHGVGEICDELRIDSDGAVTVTRRLGVYTLDPMNDAVDCDGGMYVAPLRGDEPLYDSCDNAFATANGVWIEGDYIFITGELPHTLTLVYPVRTPKVEPLGSVDITPSHPFTLKYNGNFMTEYEKDIMEEITKIIKRLERLEKGEKNEHIEKIHIP